KKNERFRYSPNGLYFIGNSSVLKTNDQTDISGTLKKFGNMSLYPFFILPGDSTAFQLRADDTLVMVSLPEGKILRRYDSVVNASAYLNPTMPVHAAGGRVAVSIGGGDTILIMRYTDGEIVQKIVGEYMQPLSFTPDGEYLISASNFNLMVVHISTGAVWRYPDFVKPEFPRAISGNGLIFFNEVSPLADCSEPKKYQPVLKMYKLNIGWVVPNDLVHAKRGINSEILENNTKLRITYADSLMLTWDIQNGQLLKHEKTNFLTYSAISPDSATSNDGKLKVRVRAVTGAELQLRDAQNDTLIRFLQGSYTFKNVSAIIFSNDSRYIIASLIKFPVQGSTVHTSALQIWEAATGKIIATYNENCPASLLSVTSDNRFIVWIAHTGKVKVFNVNGVMTDVDEHPGRISLQELCIQPNPVTDYANVRYNVESPGFLKISVHDILGREVAVLKNDYTEAGSSTVSLSGSELPMGTYFVNITGARQSKTTCFEVIR
ncbi:MAG TPA: T9SS type A sorting domain-containing protein, partial [Patescibacteria group bacterium]|nr:T9SS type A sorting domain-containing protein [Patescibacteria group bacterium]